MSSRTQTQSTRGSDPKASLILISIKVVDFWRSHVATLPHGSQKWPGWWKPFEDDMAERPDKFIRPLRLGFEALRRDHQSRLFSVWLGSHG